MAYSNDTIMKWEMEEEDYVLINRYHILNTLSIDVFRYKFAQLYVPLAINFIKFEIFQKQVSKYFFQMNKTGKLF